WEAVGNGSVKEIIESDSSKLIHFNPSGKISSYLFAFAAGKFHKVEHEKNGRKLALLHRETDSLQIARNIEAIFDLHIGAIEWLEEYTGIDYPFEKFEFAAIPSFQYGGMEHPGSVFYKASSLFLDESPTINQQLGRASLIAHETAHMWFGDLVTMEWFSDVWMKEVFANFMAAKIVNPQFPEVNHDLRFLLAHYPSAYAIDRTEGANPVRQELDNLKNAGTLYGAIIYQKAPVLMRQLENIISEETMRESLREYLKQFSYGNATWDDLVSIIDEKSPLDIEQWSRIWVYEPGMPMIDYVNEGSKLKVRQVQEEKFWPQVMQFSVVDTAKGVSWPFEVNMSEEKEVVMNFENGENTLVIPNSDGFGYAYFILDEVSMGYLLKTVKAIENPVVRGSAWINLYESVVRGVLTPEVFLRTAMQSFLSEKDPQLLSRVLNYTETVWWMFLSDMERKNYAGELERVLVVGMKENTNSGMISSYYSTFRSVVTTEEGIKLLLKIHQGEEVIKGLNISENDYITNVFELALRDVAGIDEMVKVQLEKIKNPDRKARMEFILPSLSSDKKVRDDFFSSLSKAENREHEPWVLTSLSYLHHPIRANESIEYIGPSLELLEEIQRTGDIFFPKRWLDNTFSGHSSKAAAEIVEQFLKDNPEYPEKLRMKIQQAADLTQRAAKIKEVRRG
ncbi:MAG: M1 family metallopeptidase, partial [Cyclobacteriaceae bacterium]|nr:M1 family metallopeptidase [Cyclobacteriaceae bacterium]